MCMIPIGDEAAGWLLGRDDGEARSVSLRHALIRRRPGVWGDHPRRPRSVVLVRESDEPGGWHAFGAGEAEPAVDWLTRQGRSVALLAPSAWEGAVRRRSLAVGRGFVETWVRSGEPRPAPAIARRLVEDDAPAFALAAPAWALRGWGTFRAMVRDGAAFGVPGRDGRLAAVAWIYEADEGRDSLAVATDVRFRRLGLGRAAGSALAEHSERGRRKSPIWTVAESHLPSKALARSLGFSPRAREVVLRWTP